MSEDGEEFEVGNIPDHQSVLREEESGVFLKSSVASGEEDSLDALKIVFVSCIFSFKLLQQITRLFTSLTDPSEHFENECFNRWVIISLQNWCPSR